MRWWPVPGLPGLVQAHWGGSLNLRRQVTARVVNPCGHLWGNPATWRPISCTLNYWTTPTQRYSSTPTPLSHTVDIITPAYSLIPQIQQSVLPKVYNAKLRPLSIFSLDLVKRRSVFTRYADQYLKGLKREINVLHAHTHAHTHARTHTHTYIWSIYIYMIYIYDLYI